MSTNLILNGVRRAWTQAIPIGRCASRMPLARALTIFLVAFSAGALKAQSQQPPLQAPSGPSGAAPMQAASYQYQAPQSHPHIIQQVQLTTDPRRPLDSRIEAMPRAQQKLEIIHHRSQLMVTRNPIRRMAWSDPNILDVVQFSPTEISILGLEMGTTDLWLWFEGQEQPLMYVVTVIRDPSWEEQRKVDYGRIERKLALLYPNSKVYLIPMSQKIIVRGQARDAAEAARIMQIVRGEVIVQEGGQYGYDNLNGLGFNNLGNGYLPGYQGNDMLSSLIVDELEIPGEFQVMIRVRTAELNRSQLRRFGMDWSAIINDGAVELVQNFATGANPILTGIFDNGDITVLVDALASNGTARVLDDARVVTLSGEPAAFLAGGEFAVPTIVGIGGAQGQQTSFRGFGTSIIATPTILDRDLIRLEVIPEVSAINNANSVGGIPGVDVRRVQTRVELREGQSIVLGGVFSRREVAEVSRIPFIGEIPIIGPWVFHAKQATEDESELLIVVTPEIVRPYDADQAPPMPGWYVTHPDDIDLYKFNRIEGNPDLGNYQLLPYGNGQGYGQDVGFNYFNPPPADGQLGPAATGGVAPGANGTNPYATHGYGVPNHGSQPYGAPGVATPPAYATPEYGAPQQGFPVQQPYYGQPGMPPQVAPGPTPAIAPPAAYPTPSLTPTPQANRNPAPAQGVRQASGTREHRPPARRPR